MEVVPVLGLPPLGAYAYILIADPGQWSPVACHCGDEGRGLKLLQFRHSVGD